MATMQRRDAEPTGSEFRNGMPFFGGSLWLDLLNTTPFDGTIRQDLIASPEGFSNWLDAARLPKDASVKGQHDLRSFRETLRGAIDSLRVQGRAPSGVVAEVNARLRETVIRFELVGDGERLKLDERIDPGPNGPAGIIAEDFARFVCDYDPARLKRCDNPACTMVFYDRGKNNMRRWCTMSICGNRDKVARYRARHDAKVG